MKPAPWLLLSLFLISSCKKEKTELERLPPATQEGRNTFGFLLDGKAWLPRGSYLSSGATASAFSIRTVRDGRILSSGAGRSSNDGKTGESLSLHIPHITTIGHFTLNKVADPLARSKPAYATFAVYRPESRDPTLYYTGPDAVGSVTITRFDTVAHIVSGTFDLMVREEDGTETHQLTDGRFDLRMQ